jgi:short-subunit dehydrogenase
MKAIITGSSRGLGLALAEKFLSEGIDVAISARAENDLNDALIALNSKGFNGKAIGYTVDFSQQESVTAYTNSVLKKWRYIDVLVNNVGIYGEDKADGDIAANLEKMLNVNLLSAVRMSQAVIPGMKKNEGSFIFNIVSIAANHLRSDAVSYSLSKLALKGYCDLLRKELKEFGIRVVAVYPGGMNTSSWDDEKVDHSKLIQMSDMGKILLQAMNLSGNATIEEIVVNTLKDI